MEKPSPRRMNVILRPQRVDDLVKAAGKRVADMLAPLLEQSHLVECSDEDYDAYVAAAPRHNKVEVDSEPAVSVSADNGAWVQAWVWVSDKRAGVTREEA